MPYNRSFFVNHLPRVRAIRADLEGRGLAFTPAAVAPILGVSLNSAARLVGRLRVREPGPSPASPSVPQRGKAASRAGTVNIPAEVRRALALTAQAELERAGRPLTAGELARYTGWSAWTAKQVVATLRRDGLWPDPPAAVPVPADVSPLPQPAQEELDIATECAKIRRKWSAARWAQQSGDRAPVRVAKGIDHHQRLLTHKYGSQ